MGRFPPAVVISVHTHLQQYISAGQFLARFGADRLLGVLGTAPGLLSFVMGLIAKLQSVTAGLRGVKLYWGETDALQTEDVHRV